MNNDDFKEVPDNIQDNKEETTNNIDNTNDNKSNDYEDVCYICRRPESVAGKMIHISRTCASATIVCKRPLTP